MHSFEITIRICQPEKVMFTVGRARQGTVNRNFLSLRSFFTSFKNVFDVWFCTFFHDLIHVYSPGAGTDSPPPTHTHRWQNFDVRKSLSLSHMLPVLKKISLKSDFIKQNHDLIHVYSPGIGSPQWKKVLMSTETSCHFGHMLLVSNHRRQ